VQDSGVLAQKICLVLGLPQNSKIGKMFSIANSLFAIYNVLILFSKK
jgi:hypothetical protein